MKMPELAALCTELGYREVTTYLQSGNVRFGARATKAARVEAELSSALADRFGFEVATLVRSPGELAEVAERHPFASRTTDGAKLHVTFLQGVPDPAVVAALDDVTGGDEYEVIGREVYLFTPNGYGRSKLVNPLWERKFAMPATTRNAKTVAALATL